MTTLSEQFIQKAILNPLQDQKCSQLHPGQSCNMRMLGQFLATCQGLYKLYLFVHIIPFIIFKRKKFRNKPIEEIRKLLIGFIKSLLFAGGFLALARRTVCFLNQHYKCSYVNVIAGCLVGSLTLNFQPTSRQSQIALFCINKSSETLYHLARRRNYPVRIQHGQCLLMGLSIAIISYFFQDCPQAIRINYRKILHTVFGGI